MSINSYYFLYFMIYSFLGWIVETVYCSFGEGHFVYRGFLNGPITPIYGFGSIFLIVLFNQVESIFLLFFGGMIITSLLEYITSFLMEKAFDMHWWDYSDSKYNVNGRIKLKNSILFGLGAVILIKLIHPEVISIVNNINTKVLTILSFGLFLIISIDTIFTVSSILGLKKKALALEELLVETRVSIRSSFMHRRILKTFPKLTYLKYPELITRFRKRLSDLNNKNK